MRYMRGDFVGEHRSPHFHHSRSGVGVADRQTGGSSSSRRSFVTSPASFMWERDGMAVHGTSLALARAC